jgi:amino acid transporter
VGLAHAELSRAQLLGVPDSRALRQAGLLLIFAFGGFENANVPSEETKNPRRDLPKALLAAIALTAVLYLLIQVVALGTLPALSADKTPLASAGRVFLGPLGGSLITLGAVVSTMGSLSALILVGPRILFAFGVAGQLPAGLARIHPRWSTPHVAVAAFAALALASALVGSFADLAAVSALARLLFSAATCLAVPVLRRKLPEAASFVVPGGVLVPALATTLSIWLLTGVSRTQAIAGALALGAGLAGYAVTTGFRGATR